MPTLPLPNLGAILIASSLLAPASAQDMQITARGTITGDQYFSGPYVAGQVGSTVTVTFRVLQVGTPSVPGHHVRYRMTPSTFQIAIDGVPQSGAPVAPAYFDVKDNLFAQDSLSVSQALDNGEFLEFELAGDNSWIPGTNLTALLGSHVNADPLYEQMMQLTGSGGSLFMDLDEIVIGPEVQFTPFCDPLPNSTGLPCVLAGTWQPYVGGGVHLAASQGPPGVFGYFLIGSSVDATGVLLSQGRLCLDTQPPHALGRYNLLGTDRNSTGGFDGQGNFQNFVGTATTGFGFDVPDTLPFPGAPSLQAGQSWHFQLWYREQATGDSNFSGGLTAVW